MDTEQTAVKVGKVVSDVLSYSAATVKVLVVKGAKYYAENEEAILNKLNSATNVVLGALRKGYDLLKVSAKSVKGAAEQSRVVYEELRPEVDEEAVKIADQLNECYTNTLNRFKN